MSKLFKNIVCIGDSTTSQEWCHPNWIDWLNFVFKQADTSLNYNVINSGIDGGTIDLYFENFTELIEKYTPEIVILSLGFNHIEGIKDFERKTENLINKIKSINSKVVIWSTYETINPKYSEDLKTISSMYKEISNKLDCRFIDIYSEFKKYDLKKIFTYIHKWENIEWNLKPGDIDFLHCNSIGNQIIAEKILKEVFDIDISIVKEFSGFGNMKLENLELYLNSASSN